MANFLGLLPSNVPGVTLPEMKAGVLSYSKDEMFDLDANGILEYETHTTEDKTVAAANLLKSSFLTPRQITAIVQGADVAEVTADSTITISGTNILGKPIAETLTFTANLATALTTAKAFKTISSIVFSKQADGTPKFDIGWNEVFGLPFMFAAKPFIFEKFDGAMQFTAGTLTVDADAIEKNVYDPQGSLDGLKALELLMFF